MQKNTFVGEWKGLLNLKQSDQLKNVLLKLLFVATRLILYVLKRGKFHLACPDSNIQFKKTFAFFFCISFSLNVKCAESA